jgi:leader peptidase (prepilin peptidase) / N-methyltransferase
VPPDIPVIMTVAGSAVGWWTAADKRLLQFCGVGTLAGAPVLSGDASVDRPTTSSAAGVEGKAPLACWAQATWCGFAVGAVVWACSSTGYKQGQPLGVDVFAIALGAWACGVSVLGLLDIRSYILPTVLVGATAATSGFLMILAGAISGHWGHFAQGLASALVVTIGFALWAIIGKRSVGFGDVRMAALVAFGAGSVNPGASLVAVACAVLAAGVAGLTISKARRPRVPVPLGPFLAAAAAISVVLSAA